MLRLESVNKIYQMGDRQLHALKDVNLTIAAGEFCAIVGPSGSGKSTLLSILGILDQPTSGDYFLNNQPVSGLDSDQRAKRRNDDLGFIFQSFYLLPRLTALENVCLPLWYRGQDIAESREQGMSLLKKMDLGRWASHYPSELSGGQQQRVAVARALIGKPSLILADEPTGALDSKTGTQLLQLLTELNQQYQVTLVIVTHDEKVAKACRRVIQINDGVISE